MISKIEKAFISFRISPVLWKSETRFQELLGWFEKYNGVTDEISFFPDINHAAIPLETTRTCIALLAQRFPDVRRAGYQATINLHCTVGHFERSLHNALKEDYTLMTAIDGQISRGCFCPNDEGMRGYIRELYTILASADPDYIWIDDDVRLIAHMPVMFACFCDNCLNIFEKESGEKHSRESLLAAFNEGSIENKLEVRKAWLQHNRNTIARLFELIEETVHGIKPGLPLGFMDGDRFFEGYDCDNWAKALSGPDGAEVRWRPGGSFYKDDTLGELVMKSHTMGREASMLPDSVVSIQSEIENALYEKLRKAAHTTALEAASHMAAGCTGAAFNVLTRYDEPLDEYEPMIAKLHRTRPFYDLMAREQGRARPQGLHTGWNKDSFVVNCIHEGNWVGERVPWGSTTGYAEQILENGIPACYSWDHASVFALAGDSVLAMGEDEILQILSAGAFMDAQTLDHLNEMGHEELTGFVTEQIVEQDCIEEFTDDPLNGPFAGRQRDGIQAMHWGEPATMLKPASAASRVLTRALDDYNFREIAPCCMGVFKNRLGGRICVSGYFPWKFLHNHSKSSQIKSVIRWLSKDGLLAHVSSFHKINLWVRRTESNRLTVAMTNSCLDPAEDVTLMLLADSEEIDVFDMDCDQLKIAAHGSDGPYKKFTLPTIEPWHMQFILA